MAKINYKKLSVLVADDFSTFRNTVNGMLMNLGITDIEMASSGEEVLEKCEKRDFDVIFCDHDLGPGRNGQHVLEQLRFEQKVNRRHIFIMVSAEASRNIVLSAYDCEPDDYLMKPITARMLQQRMSRQISLRNKMRSIYDAIDRGELAHATDKLIDLSLAQDRSAIAAQKLLGELFIQQEEFRKAERLYTKTLEVRPLDWARLGLAIVKQKTGDVDVANDYLTRIVDENPLYLPAYDVLADNWEIQGENDKSQGTMHAAVQVSPMSILRQKRLAGLAEDNGDVLIAIEALRRASKLGKFSCYGTVDDCLNLGRLVTSSIQNDIELPEGTRRETLDLLDQAQNWYNLSHSTLQELQSLQSDVASARPVEKQISAVTVTDYSERVVEQQSLDEELAHVTRLLEAGNNQEAEKILEELKNKYKDDEQALERLDLFLNEPASESNREMVANINREGIDLYNEGRFDDALECFDKARQLFPKHIGIQLNIVQALIGKMRLQPEDDSLIEQCQVSLDLVASLIDEDHEQFNRYKQLFKMASAVGM